jgi:hypothetical protein
MATEPFRPAACFTSTFLQEAMMRYLGLMPFVAIAIVASVTLAPAQSSGTEPQDKGNTGWTGGSRDQPSQSGQDGKASATTGQNTPDPAAQAAAQAAQAARDTESAKTQPLMAEGVDLKGPPRQFPANKTPE